MLAQQQATDFAEAWLAAWNAHDLDRIMDHYAAAVEYSSPTVPTATGSAPGILRDRQALRTFFEQLLHQFSELHFELQTVFTGVQSVVLCYKSLDGLLAAEYMQLNDEGKVVQATAHHLRID